MFVKRDNIAQHISPFSKGVKVAGVDVRLNAPDRVDDRSSGPRAYVQ